uniref:Uncharacterized protein n=1 Tax=Meloidogyne incognita TaxID=6306 RepID=A0A914KK59_MELIC
MIGLKNVNYVPGISPEQLKEFFIEYVKIHPLHKLTFNEANQVLQKFPDEIDHKKGKLEIVRSEITKSKGEEIRTSTTNIVISSKEDLQKEKSSSKKGKISPKSPVGGKTKFQTINRNKLEKCHQIVFVLKYFVSKYIFCGICDFNEDQKNEIYEFIRELNENLVPSCEFLRKWTSDLARDSVDLKINGVTKASSDHLYLDKISKLYEIYTDLKKAILSDIIHKETLKKIIESGSPGASESYHKLHSSLHINSGRVSPTRQLDKGNLEQQTKNSIFKNLNDIAKLAGSLEDEIAKIFEDLKKDKALNAKHENIVFSDIIAEKMEFLTQNFEETLKNMENDNTNNDGSNDTNYSSMSKELVKDHANKFSKTSREFVGYCLSNRFIEAFKGNHEVNVGKEKFQKIPTKYYEHKIAEYFKEQTFEIG